MGEIQVIDHGAFHHLMEVAQEVLHRQAVRFPRQETPRVEIDVEAGQGCYVRVAVRQANAPAQVGTKGPAAVSEAGGLQLQLELASEKISAGLDVEVVFSLGRFKRQKRRLVESLIWG